MRIFYLDNVASHYRKSIFLLMDQTYDIDYLFGKSLGDINQMDTSLLRGPVEKTETKKPKTTKKKGKGKFSLTTSLESSIFRKVMKQLANMIQ